MPEVSVHDTNDERGQDHEAQDFLGSLRRHPALLREFSHALRFRSDPSRRVGRFGHLVWGACSFCGAQCVVSVDCRAFLKSSLACSGVYLSHADKVNDSSIKNFYCIKICIINLHRICMQNSFSVHRSHSAFPTGFPQALVETKSILIRFCILTEMEKRTPWKSSRWNRVGHCGRIERETARSLSSCTIESPPQSSHGPSVAQRAVRAGAGHDQRYAIVKKKTSVKKKPWPTPESCQ